MTHLTAFRRGLLVGILSLLIPIGDLFSQAPAEVQNLEVQPSGDLLWDSVAGADFYNVYLAQGGGSSPIGPLTCLDNSTPVTSLTATEPDLGQIFAFVVTAESTAEGEGTPGNQSGGSPRYLQGACTPLMRTHILNRGGYGWNEWSRDRIVALDGIDAYINEQLNPSSIYEGDNYTLNAKLAQYTPPLDGIDLIGRHVVYGVYARRQLARKMGTFWWNHFNTEWNKIADFFREAYPDCAAGSDPACDSAYPSKGHLEAAGAQLRDFDKFSDLAFNGNFRQMLEAGTLSPGMLVYLDLYTSIAGEANENQPRELLELHSMSVDGGYSQQDVEELSRLLTGWGLCKKALADVDDPLAACIPDYWAQPGQWTATFDILRHDCGSKTLFPGTPQETIFPGSVTCTEPADITTAMAEFDLALDIIAAHPSTPRFISRKLLELLVTDQPTEAMIDQLVLVWDDAGNPNGVGDLREVTREALTLSMSPAHVGNKVKTPFEQAVTSLRTLRGNTDGLAEILAYLNNSDQVPFFNEVPTGYSEQGGDWVSTGGLMARQNWGVRLATIAPSITFSSNPITLLTNEGISTAPGNTEEIVDFFIEILFGGALTVQERQATIEFLNTDEFGNPSPYDDARIRSTVALLLGFPQFLEQ